MSVIYRYIFIYYVCHTHIHIYRETRDRERLREIYVEIKFCPLGHVHPGMPPLTCPTPSDQYYLMC